jgi:melibiose permease/lactose/raffinose/galactose permease
MILASLGYVLLFFVRPDFMPAVCLCGVLIFVGNANLLLISWMFLVDSIDYGHWKLGRRNDSVNVSATSFANKMGSAISNGLIGSVIIVSKIKGLNAGDALSESGVVIVKSAMTLIPLLFLVAGCIVYSCGYKINEKTHSLILDDLMSKGDIKNDEQYR